MNVKVLIAMHVAMAHETARMPVHLTKQTSQIINKGSNTGTRIQISIHAYIDTYSTQTDGGLYPNATNFIRTRSICGRRARFF